MVTKKNGVRSTVEEFKKNSLRFRLVPLESTSTLPIPVTINGKIYLAFVFFTGNRLKKDEEMKIFAPNSKILVNLKTARIVQYVALDEFKNSMEEPIGTFPHKTIESMTLKEYNKQKMELLEKYDKAIDLFVNNKRDAVFKQEFRDLFYRLCEPCLLADMKKIGKNFFAWLEDKSLT